MSNASFWDRVVQAADANLWSILVAAGGAAWWAARKLLLIDRRLSEVEREQERRERLREEDRAELQKALERVEAKQDRIFDHLLSNRKGGT